MRNLAVLLAASIIPGIGACSESEECIDHSSPYYDQGVARALTALGVKASVKPGRGVCFPQSAMPQFKQARAEVDRYFYEVADTLRDSCEEAAYVEWAKREKLPFEVHDTTSSSGPGRMINIYSFSAAEVEANRTKLSQTPRGKRCS